MASDWLPRTAMEAAAAGGEAGQGRVGLGPGLAEHAPPCLSSRSYKSWS